MKSVAAKAAKDAGNLLLKNLGKVSNVNIKDQQSLVTNIDLEADKLIQKIILEKYPDHNIITEESGSINNNSPYTWHVDPLDGTHNYVRGLPLFGVSIALEYNNEIILGVINLPALKRLYTAVKGKGVYCNSKKVSVSEKTELDFSYITLDFNPPIRKKGQDYIKKLKNSLIDIRIMGCACYALTQIAHGNIDAYVIFKTNSWDIAAGFLMIEEASGLVTNLKNNPWSISEDSFLASNGHLHKKLLEFL